MTFTVDWYALIMDEIADPKMTRDNVAMSYAALIVRRHRDWRPINVAILERWSPYALEYIKAKALKNLEELSA